MFIINQSSVFIDGEDIFLRPLALEDCEGDYANWFNDADICDFNSHHVYPSYKDELVEYVRNLQTARSELVLAVVRKKDLKHIGNISLQNINYVHRSAEMASIVAEKGIDGLWHTIDATERILEHGFMELNLNRIYAGTFNPVIASMLDRMGFQREGVRRSAFYKHGKYRDVVDFGLLKDEWMADRNRLERGE